MSARAPFRDFTAAEHGVWRQLFERQTPLRAKQLVPRFLDGMEALGLSSDGVPDLERVNRRLLERTGFKGVPVEGFETPVEFFRMLSRREFPIGNFIRDARDLNYTPAPDVFHDLYGHIPFLAAEDYAEFCADFGRRAGTYGEHPLILKQFDRLFWFTIEFALENTSDGLRVLGAGIASSFGECAYSLSGAPEVLPFDPDRIRNQDFRIDEMQKRLFCVNSAAELFGCLDRFEEGLQALTTPA